MDLRLIINKAPMYSESSDESVNIMKLANFYKYNKQDLIKLKIFWQITLDNEWFYLSPRIIYEYYLHVEDDIDLNFFNKILLNTFVENVDYIKTTINHKLVTDYIQNEEVVVYLKNFDHYIITMKTFKAMSKMINRIKSLETYHYLCKIETLCELVGKFSNKNNKK
jgi:hypothetical protein